MKKAEQPELMPPPAGAPVPAPKAEDIIQQLTPTPVLREQQPPTPRVDAMRLLLRAVSDPACDPAKMSALLAVKREWDADAAAADFNQAVVGFQQECPIIPKLDKAYDKMYARMDRIWRTIRPLLQKHGLALTWESSKITDGVCILEGHLRHARGHAEPLHQEVPLPDLIKGQNTTQRAGSGETYAKRYATCAALGVQVGDDDDGNAAGGEHCVTPEQAAELRRLVEENRGGDATKLCAWAGVDVIDLLPESKYAEAKRILEKKIGA